MSIFDKLSMRWQNILAITFYTALSALAIIGWTWVLHFPWAWVFYTVLTIQIFMLFLVNYSEYQASFVNGAAGWSTFGYIFFQGTFVIIVTVLRLIVWLAQGFGLI